jgi:hypothetical protein
MRRTAAFILLLTASLANHAYAAPPFTVEAVEDASPDFPGAPKLHSFAFAQWEGKWVFIGGRTNGYHSVGGGPAEFMRADANKDIFVVDTTVHPAKTYKYPVMGLPKRLGKVKEQWLAAAFAWVQVSDKLYIAGGYGQNEAGDWLTHPVLSVVSLPAFIDGVMKATLPDNSIQFTESPLMQVSGGDLLKLPGGDFYMVMGHVFMGSYTSFEGNNEKNRGTVSQDYTEEIRQLKIATPADAAPQITLVKAFKDEEFHRRDLNVTYFATPAGIGLAAYGGVFTPKTQQQYTKPVYLFPGKAPVVDQEFEQKMNSYAAANLLLYDKQAGVMYTTIFGGISRYYWDPVTKQFCTFATEGDKFSVKYLDGMQWTDQVSTLVQKMNTASVAQGKPSDIEEFVQPKALPGIMGSDGLFIPLRDAARLDPTTPVLDYTTMKGKRTLVGYIYGGIQAFPYQFPYTPGSRPYSAGTVPSKASEKILKVYVTAEP